MCGTWATVVVSLSMLVPLAACGGAPNEAPSTKPATHATDVQPAAAQRDAKFPGTYVDFDAKEINVQIRFLSTRGCRAKEIADYISSRVSARMEPQPSALAEIFGESSYSFVPDGLGKIRDFAVRVWVGTACGPTEVAKATLGASAIVLDTPDTDARASIDSVVASPSYYAGTPVVLFVADPRGKDPVDPRAAATIQTTGSTTTEYFPSLKAALKLALLDLKKDPGTDVAPLVPVAIPSLLETLQARQRELGRPLTQAEVMSLRDHARFVALSPEQVTQLIQRRGYRDLDPAHLWEDWTARSGQPSSATGSGPKS